MANEQIVNSCKVESRSHDCHVTIRQAHPVRKSRGEKTGDAKSRSNNAHALGLEILKYFWFNRIMEIIASEMFRAGGGRKTTK